MSAQPKVLYVIVCAAGPASYVGVLVEEAIGRGWDTYVIPTPSAVDFLDIAELETATGHPVRSRYRLAGEPGRLPHANAMIVAPATYNTINKWASGISDTFALGLLAEMIGLGVSTAVLPFVNSALAANRSYQRSLDELQAAGVDILVGPGAIKPHPSGTGETLLKDFPWHLALDAIEEAGKSAP